ncbi:hypothetical protein D3C72_1696670 [compost metagenome]
MAAIGAQLDHVEGVVVFIGNGVGADLFQLGFQAAIDGEVVGSELDHGFLAGMQESDVLRADTRFNQQGVIQRYDFDQVAARLNHTADSVDQQLLDDTAHR